MAGVAAELTGVPGACLVTRGPGVASAANGVAQALLDRQPIVVISDCVEEAERDRVSHQRLDQRALMSTVTKASLRYGPADVDVPATGGRAGPAAAAPGRSTSTSTPPRPVRADVVAHRAAATRRQSRRASRKRSVGDARRPVIVAGVGARGEPAGEGRWPGSSRPTTSRSSRRTRRGASSPTAARTRPASPPAPRAEAPLLEAADVIIGIGLDPVELIPAPWPYPAPVVLLGSWAIDDSTYFGDRLVGEVVGDLPALVDALGEVIRSDWPRGDAQRHRAASDRRDPGRGPRRPERAHPPGGRDDRPGGRAGRDDRHHRRRRPHARRRPAVGGRGARRAPDLQRPGHDGLRPPRRHRRRARRAVTTRRLLHRRRRSRHRPRRAGDPRPR